MPSNAGATATHRVGTIDHIESLAHRASDDIVGVGEYSLTFSGTHFDDLTVMQIDSALGLLRAMLLLAIGTVLLLGGCASRPVNPRISDYVPDRGYQYSKRVKHSKYPENLVVLAFSGGGTRAAAFAYGVLEVLRRTQLVDERGVDFRLLDEVDVITGVSGGSFTALAYGLLGESLFDEYENRFLKRNVQAELIARFLNPLKWGELWSEGWGRSELAAQLYDDLIFDGATFNDLDRGNGPMINVTATDLSTGSRVAFTQGVFDALCSDLGSMRLSRAAAASSALPVVLSAVTINNYGGTCNYRMPTWIRTFAESSNPPRPAARAERRLRELQQYENGVERPYIHLVDGGVSDNLGLRGALELIEGYEALYALGQRTPLDSLRRIVIFIVNSLSTPTTEWDKSERPPGILDTLLKATGVPIDRYSFEAVESLKETASRWQTLKRIRDSPAFVKEKDPALADVLNAPKIDLYAIDVSFAALSDKAEQYYLDHLPTSFSLTDEDVDRLRTAAAKIILDSLEFQRLLNEMGARVLDSNRPVYKETNSH